MAEMMKVCNMAPRERWYGLSCLVPKTVPIPLVSIERVVIIGLAVVNDIIDDIFRSSVAGIWMGSRWLG